MGRKLYEQIEQGGIRFVSNRRPGDVRIPNYVYDMWMPLIGSDAMGVYAVYCRLERQDVVKAMSLGRIAKMCRIGTRKLNDINEKLEKCGFIRVRKPQGHERLMHWTTEILVLDPAQKIPQELIDELSPPSGYETLSPWLVADDPEMLDDISGNVGQQPDTMPSNTSNVEALDLKSSEVERAVSGEQQDNSHLLPHVWDLEESPGTEHTCPECEGLMTLGELKTSRACCPHCSLPVRVVAGDKTIKKAARPRPSRPNWHPALKAFCNIAPLLAYSNLSSGERYKMIADLQAIAQEHGFDLPALLEAIPKLDIYEIEKLTTPRQYRFGRALMEYKLTGKVEQPTPIILPDAVGEQLRRLRCGT